MRRPSHTGGYLAVSLLAFAAAGCGQTSTSARPEPKPDITVVSTRSFCVATGIDDLYTGDGHVTFYVTLRNAGGASGDANVVPVRHYSDGQENESALDEVTATVAPHSTQGFRTDPMVYKAHEHDVMSCGVIVDGGAETPINVQ